MGRSSIRVTEPGVGKCQICGRENVPSGMCCRCRLRHEWLKEAHRNDVRVIRELEFQLAAAVEALKRHGDCEDCRYEKKLGECPDDAVSCDECGQQCACRDCAATGSHWEWKGPEMPE